MKYKVFALARILRVSEKTPDAIINDLARFQSNGTWNNIPKSFFMNNKILQNFGKGHLDIDIHVYSGESRKSTEKGEYYESLCKGNYKLVSVRRHRY